MYNMFGKKKFFLKQSFFKKDPEINIWIPGALLEPGCTIVMDKYKNVVQTHKQRSSKLSVAAPREQLR